MRRINFLLICGIIFSSTFFSSNTNVLAEGENQSISKNISVDKNIDQLSSLKENGFKTYNLSDKTDLSNNISNYDTVFDKIKNINDSYMNSSINVNGSYQKLDSNIFKDEGSSDLITEINYRNEYTYLLNRDDELINYNDNFVIDSFIVEGNCLGVKVYRGIDKVVYLDKEKDGVEKSGNVDCSDSNYEFYIFMKNDDGNWVLDNIIYELTGSNIELEGNLLDNTFKSRKTGLAYTEQTIKDFYEADSFVPVNDDINDSINKINRMGKAGTHWKNYSKASALSYAKTHAYNYNNDYWHFNTKRKNPPARDVGGDCTNFVSQCVQSGGLAMNGNWMHTKGQMYTASWIHTEHFRNYLINSGIATGYWKTPPTYSKGVGLEGTVIQGRDSSKGYWTHSAIIKSGTKLSNIRVIQHSDDSNDNPWKFSPENTRFFRIY